MQNNKIKVATFERYNAFHIIIVLTSIMYVPLPVPVPAPVPATKIYTDGQTHQSYGPLFIYETLRLYLTLKSI